MKRYTVMKRVVPSGFGAVVYYSVWDLVENREFCSCQESKYDNDAEQRANYITNLLNSV